MADYLNAQKKQEIFGQYGTSNKTQDLQKVRLPYFHTVSPILPNT